MVRAISVVLVVCFALPASAQSRRSDEADGVGVGRTTRSGRGPISGKKVAILQPQGNWGYWIRNEEAESAMKDMVERLGGVRVLNTNEADILLVGRFSVELAHRQQREGFGRVNLPRVGGTLGQFIPRDVDLSSRNETYDFTADVDFDFATRGQNNQPSNVVMRMVGKSMRKAVRSSDQQLRASFGRFFGGNVDGFRQSNQTEETFIAKAALAIAFEDAEPRAIATRRQAVQTFAVTRFVSDRIIGASVDNATADRLTEGQVVSLSSDGVEVGKARIKRVSGLTVTLEVLEHEGKIDGSVHLDVEVTR